MIYTMTTPRFHAQSLRKNKQNRWEAKIYDTYNSKVLTTCSSVSREKAKNKIIRKLAELNGEPQGDITISQSVEMWLATLTVKHSTMTAYQSSKKSLLKIIPPHTLVKNIKPSFLKSLHLSNHHILIIKAALNLMVEDGEIKSSPAKSLAYKPKKQNPNIAKAASNPFLLYSDVEKITKRAERYKDTRRLLTQQRNLLLILFSITTGARAMEILGIQHQDIDSSVWHLEHQLDSTSTPANPVFSSLKSCGEREIPIPEFLRQAINNHASCTKEYGDTSFIFNSMAPQGSINHAEYSILTRLVSSFEVNWSWHCWRHYSNYIMQRVGASTATRASILGHSNKESLTDGVYLTTTMEEKERATSQSCEVATRIFGKLFMPLACQTVSELKDFSDYHNSSLENPLAHEINRIPADLETFPSELWNIGHHRML